MDFINVNLENIDSQDICCANSDKKGDICAASKKAWLRQRQHHSQLTVCSITAGL